MLPEKALTNTGDILSVVKEASTYDFCISWDCVNGFVIARVDAAIEFINLMTLLNGSINQ